jgi:hypothetical protein
MAAFRASTPASPRTATTIPWTMTPPWAWAPATCHPAELRAARIPSASRVTSVVSLYQNICTEKLPSWRSAFVSARCWSSVKTRGANCASNCSLASLSRSAASFALAARSLALAISSRSPSVFASASAECCSAKAARSFASAAPRFASEASFPAWAIFSSLPRRSSESCLSLASES